jgi:hypothetical protein
MATIILFGANMLLEFFVPFFMGNEIEHDWSKLLSDIYTIDWLGGKKEAKMNLKIVQEILKAKFQLQAGKVFPINLASFLAIIKSAYSMYAVLRSMKN